MLAVLGLMQKFTCAQSFCGYIIFELWEHDAEEDMKLRVILNPSPFKSAASVQCRDVQEHDSTVLAELGMKDVESLVLRLRQGVAPFVLKPWKDANKASKTAIAVDEDNDAC